MLWFTKKNTWLKGTKHGWGNGYVAVPKGHPLYGIWEDDKVLNCIDVHGGITFIECLEQGKAYGDFPSEAEGMWCFGWDTSHAGDNSDRWTQATVTQETFRFYMQLEKLARKLEQGEVTRDA